MWGAIIYPPKGLELLLILIILWRMILSAGEDEEQLELSHIAIGSGATTLENSLVVSTKA